MATNFPTGLDDFANYVDGVTILEAATLNDMQFAIEALQAKVGINSSAVTTSHDYKLANLMPSSKTSKSKDTNYTAEAFGLLLVTFDLTWDYNYDVYVTILSDDNTTPTTVIAKQGVQTVRADSENNISHHSILVPILSGKKYRVEDTDPAGGKINNLTINWHPFSI